MAVATLARILAQLHGCTQPEPNQWQSRCPAHEETEASFGMAIDPDGRIKLNCFVGCSKDAICRALGITLRDLAPDDSPAGSPRPAPLPSTKISSDELEKRCAEWAANLAAHPLAKAKLALLLDLPEEVFDQLPGLGARMDHRDGPCWTFPERDANYRVTGIGLRFRDGKKRVEDDTTRGLTIPAGWQDKPGALYIVEGPSDVLAMTAAGLACIGRPSVAGGVKLLAEFVNLHVPKDRPAYWIGENDQNLKTKKWPGRDESGKACARFAAEVPNPVSFGMVPNADYKDMRSWLTGLVNESVPWGLCGDRVRTFFKPTLVGVVRPASGGEKKDKKDKKVPKEIVKSPTLDGRARIELGPNNEKPINDAAIKALASDPGVFGRGDFLVTVIDEPASSYRGCQFPPGPRIVEIEPNVLREKLETRADFIAVFNGKEEHVIPPERVVSTIRGRKVWPGMKYLEAVTPYPVLRKDGTIVLATGYDERTGVYYAPDSDIPVVPENPTKDDAAKAWKVLQEMVCDFPFVEESHKSSWLAAFLTPLARFAFRGPAPMFLLEANAPGTGKGLLADTIAIPLTGQEFACSAYSSEDEEMQKRVTMIAVEGDKLVLLDNIVGPFGGATVDLMLTSVRWTGRILGSNKSANVPLWATWYATGNNMQFVGDIMRRICPCRLTSKLKNPEERKDFTHPNLREWVKENRPRLLGAALTILRAYYVAGSPVQEMTPWGSYEGWSRVIRGAIIWMGLPDPYKARDEVRSSADATRGAIETIIEQWENLSPPAKGLTCGKILAQVFPEKPATTPHWLSDIAEAIESLMPRPNAAALGRHFLAYRERRVENQRYLDFVSKRSNTTYWCVKNDKTGLMVGVVEKGSAKEGVVGMPSVPLAISPQMAI